MMFLAEATTQPRLGPLGPVVANAGYVFGAVAALLAMVRGRSRWEPAEEDLPKAADRIGAVLAGGLLVVLFIWLRDPGTRTAVVLTVLLAVAGGGLLAVLLYYVYLIGAYVRDVPHGVDAAGAEVTRRVIAGDRLEPGARAAMKEHKVTLDQLLRGCGGDLERVWSRPARAKMKARFYLVYIALIVTAVGTVTATALLLLRAAG